MAAQPVSWSMIKIIKSCAMDKYTNAVTTPAGQASNKDGFLGARVNSLHARQQLDTAAKSGTLPTPHESDRTPGISFCILEQLLSYCSGRSNRRVFCVSLGLDWVLFQ